VRNKYKEEKASKLGPEGLNPLKKTEFYADFKLGYIL